MEPRGFEPLTSAVQRRLDRFQEYSQSYKIGLVGRILAGVLFRGFQVLNPG